MQFLLYLFIFLFGLAIGSFLNVLIIRLESGRREGIGDRSRCPKCGRELAWQDLVPVLSFLWLGGKCRYCKERISLQYPIVETTTAFLFLLISNKILSVQFQNFQISDAITLIYLLFITSCLIVIFVSDLKYFIIPDEIIVSGIIGAILYRILDIYIYIGNNAPSPPLILRGGWGELILYLMVAMASGAFFLAIVLITRGRGMGLGDVKMAFLMGLILGWPQIVIALLLAFVSGALVGLSLIIFSRAKFTSTPREVWGMKSEIPFGTFLAVSTFLMMIWGGGILSKYFDFLF